MDSRTVIQLLAQHRGDLARFGVKDLALFGSTARGTAAENSDIDMLVEFDRPIGLFEFLKLKAFLEELFARPVDLVTADALKPQLRERILRESVRAT